MIKKYLTYDTGTERYFMAYQLNIEDEMFYIGIPSDKDGNIDVKREDEVINILNDTEKRREHRFE